MASEISQALRFPRKRASVACLNCRTRKVRCDVARHGAPCSNCRLDDDSCSVLARKSRKRDGLCRKMAHFSSTTMPVTGSSDETLGMITEQDPDDALRPTSSPSSEDVNRQQVCTDLESLTAGEDARGTKGDQAAPPAVEPLTESHRPHPSRMRGECRDVVYTYHRFLQQNQFSHLSARDFHLLDTQNCLRVPTRDILDEFVQQYFLHMHPLLPMMDEADFWRRYGDGQGVAPHRGISLLLIQAMLFAACNCVSAQTIFDLGFSSSRGARAEFYRRAKLLYEMNAESSSPALAQAALLLSSWTPPGEPKGSQPNTWWLTVAIQRARNEDAHLYHCWPQSESSNARRMIWKKIWWCCIIRDRVLSLGLRRPLQITRDNFDFASAELLTDSEFNDEIENSPVYNKQAKCLLTRILIRIAELCVILTDLHSISLWLETPRNRAAERLPSHLDDVQRVKQSLRGWREETDAIFSMSLQQGELAGWEAAAVHLHVMYMYYYSASISLSHHEILLATMVIPTGTPYDALRSGYTSSLLNELRDTSGCVAECLEGLLKSGLIQLLPISTVAFLAVPLMHHILDRHATNDDSDAKAARRGNRLNALIKAMRVFQTHYDGVEWLSSVLQKALQPDRRGQSDRTCEATGPGGLENPPVPYLQIAFTIDFSLSRSRYAEASDIPDYLEELLQEKSPRQQEDDSSGTSPRKQLDTDPVAANWGPFLSADDLEDVCTLPTTSDDSPKTVDSDSLEFGLIKDTNSAHDGTLGENRYADEWDVALLNILSIDHPTQMDAEDFQVELESK